MIKLRTAILDTSALIVLEYLGLLPYLSYFYGKILIPLSVEREFLNTKAPNLGDRRYENLLHCYENYFFEKCDLDTAIEMQLFVELYGLNEGEAEVLAQNQLLANRCEMIIDERRARKIAKAKNLKFHGVLHLLARMDIELGVCNYFHCVHRIKSELGFWISKKVAKEVYNRVLKAAKQI